MNRGSPWENWDMLHLPGFLRRRGTENFNPAGIHGPRLLCDDGSYVRIIDNTWIYIYILYLLYIITIYIHITICVHTYIYMFILHESDFHKYFPPPPFPKNPRINHWKRKNIASLTGFSLQELASLPSAVWEAYYAGPVKIAGRFFFCFKFWKKISTQLKDVRVERVENHWLLKGSVVFLNFG